MTLSNFNLAGLSRRAAVLLAFAATVLLVVPFSPHIAGTVGEPWPYAMNFATVQHFVFGRDIVFTFGPLNSIYTHVYHPATDAMMLAGVFFLVCALFGGLLTITPSARRGWLLLVPLLLSRFPFEACMIVTLPLLWVMTAASASSKSGRWSLAVVYFIGVACTLLTLVKGSMAIAVGGCAAIAFASLWSRSHKAALGLLAICVGALGCLWQGIGQPLSALPMYFVNQIPIVSGYTTAMASSGPAWEAFAFVGFATILFWALSGGAIRKRWAAAAASAFVLFLAFKAAFVRHDAHALIGAAVLAWVGLLALIEKPTLTGRGIVGALAGAIGCLTISSSYQSIDVRQAGTQLVTGLRISGEALRQRFVDPERLPRRYEEENEKIRRWVPLPQFSGDADIYPENAPAVIASGARWNPRPVVISYGAYTPSLALMDAEHLRTHAPARVYFAITPIDHRYPSLEDGASWPTLMSDYVPIGFSGMYAVLDHREGAGEVTLSPATAVHQAVGRSVDLRAYKGPLWATIKLKPTLAGRLASLLYKLPELRLSAIYADGRHVDYRLIPGMAETGFLLSPTVSNATEFVALQSKASRAMLKKEIPVSVGIYGASGTRWLWSRGYDLTLQTMTIGDSADAANLLLGPLKEGEPTVSMSTGGDCTVDETNGRPFTPGETIITDNVLEIRGWAVTDRQSGRSHNAVRLVLTQGNKTFYALSDIQSRPDVGVALGHPDMTNAGFFARTNATGLLGDFELRILQDLDGKTIQCPTVYRVHFNEPEASVH